MCYSEFNPVRCPHGRKSPLHASAVPGWRWHDPGQASRRPHPNPTSQRSDAFGKLCVPSDYPRWPIITRAQLVAFLAGSKRSRSRARQRRPSCPAKTRRQDRNIIHGCSVRLVAWAVVESIVPENIVLKLAAPVLRPEHPSPHYREVESLLMLAIRPAPGRIGRHDQ